MELPAGFDPTKYLELNPDLVAAYGWDTNQATQHYLNYGGAEGRNYGATTATADTTAPSVGGLPAGFDPAKYLELNPDLIAAYGNDTTQATQHYLNWGAAENRNYGQAGWGGITDPHTYWANSGLPAAEIDRRISLGYARPETWEGYGPGSPFWSQLGGVNPTDPGWNDYYKRAENWSSTGSPEAQARANDDGGFGDLLPVIALIGIGLATGGFGLAGAGTMSGVEAGVMTAAEAAAAETAAMSAWAAAPATSLTETVLTNAAIGAGTSAIRGGDPLTGAITGGVGGLISGSGILSDVSGGLIDATGATGAAATAITKGVNAAATGAIGALANGGSFSDVLSGGVVGGLTSGVGNYVAGTVLPGTNNTLASGAGGAASGLIQAALTGGDIVSGILTGGLAGAAGGLAKDMGAGPVTAGAVGALTGGLIKSAVQQDPVSAAKSFNPPPAISTTPAAGKFGLSFSDIIPQFSNKKVPWGTRLSGA